MKAHTLLCVDDEIENVEALHRLFRKHYNVLSATSGNEALDLLRQHRVQLIISDQRMPQMTGVEFLQASQELQPESVRILLTGYTDIESVIGAINQGHVYRYVTKPWDSADLLTTVAQALEYYDLHAELAQKNRDLALALQELKTLDEAKSHFMILINHELKTPLTSLTSFLSLLRESELNGEQHHYVGRIEQATQRLQKLIDDSLLLISAETGQLPIHSQTHPAASLFPDLTGNFAKLRQERNLQITSEFAAVPVWADAKVIQQVLRHLVENALRFAEPGSTIELKAVHNVHNSDHCEICIRNQGPPLPAHVLHKILQPFAMNQDIMKHSRGLGLGLSLAQALLRAHGSSLQIRSEDGFFQASFNLPTAP